MVLNYMVVLPIVNCFDGLCEFYCMVLRKCTFVHTDILIHVGVKMRKSPKKLNNIYLTPNNPQ